MPHNPAYYLGQMEPVAANHDTGAKTILGGAVLPAGQSADKDLDDALDLIFNHPNVPETSTARTAMKVATTAS
jgi:uncharacterized protein (DUF1800 family)